MQAEAPHHPAPASRQEAQPEGERQVGAARGSGARKARARLRMLAGVVLIWALVYVLVYIPAHGNGSDFQVFYAGAYADGHGVDPFSWPQLWQVEQRLYNGGLDRTLPFYFAPYGDPPPFALALRPLTLWPEPAAYRVWAVLLLIAGGAGAFLGLHEWPRVPRLLGAGLAAISPVALFNIRLGQNSTPLLLSMGLSLALLAARRPALAGVALSLGLFKPHLMLPIAAIAILAAPHGDRRPMALGFLAAAAVWAAAGLLLDGGLQAYQHWLDSVRGFSDSIGHQPDIASVPGLYVGWAPAGLAGALTLVCRGTTVLIIVALAYAARHGDVADRKRLLGGGIAAYLAFSSYVHTGDQVLLILPLLALIGQNGNGLRDSAVLLAAAACVLAPMVVLRDYHTVGINALPPLCVLLATILGPSRVPEAVRDAQDVATAQVTALRPTVHG